MKKSFICGGVLCMALLLSCATALAEDMKVTPTAPETVQVEQIAKGEDVAFQVTKSVGVESGQLYLIMIQEGDDANEKPKPTKDNLYYMNVEAAEGSSISLEAYPKDMNPQSSYVVYLSDYSEGNDGAAMGVALISAQGGDNPVEPGGEILYGDINGDGAVDVKDRIALTRHLARWTGYAEADLANFRAADVNTDGVVDVKDRIALTRYLARWTGYETLPYNP